MNSLLGALHLDGPIVGGALIVMIPAMIFAVAARLRRYHIERRHRRLLRLIARRLAVPDPRITRSHEGEWELDVSQRSNAIEPALTGGYRGAPPPAQTRARPGESVWTRLSASIHRAAGMLRVLPTGCEEADWSGAPTHAIGDAMFDAAFTTRTWQPEGAAQVLGLELRRVLLGLPRSVDSPRLTVDSGELRIEWLGEPEPATVERVASVIRRVAAGAE